MFFVLEREIISLILTQNYDSNTSRQLLQQFYIFNKTIYNLEFSNYKGPHAIFPYLPFFEATG